MATGNFSMYRNSSIFPAYCMSQDLTDDDPELSYIYCEEAIYSVREKLVDKFGKNCVDWESGRLVDRNNSICEVSDFFEFAGSEFSVTYKVTYESGYYEGFTLDWELKSMGEDYSEIPDVEQLAEDLEYYYDLNPGLARMLAPKLQKRFQKVCEKIENGIDEVFTETSPHDLAVTAVCSNGETFYIDKKHATTSELVKAENPEIAVPLAFVR